MDFAPVGPRLFLLDSEANRLVCHTFQYLALSDTLIICLIEDTSLRSPAWQSGHASAPHYISSWRWSRRGIRQVLHLMERWADAHHPS
jgi:hypothetical protein